MKSNEGSKFKLDFGTVPNDEADLRSSAIAAIDPLYCPGPSSPRPFQSTGSATPGSPYATLCSVRQRSHEWTAVTADPLSSPPASPDPAPVPSRLVRVPTRRWPVQTHFGSCHSKNSSAWLRSSVSSRRERRERERCSTTSIQKRRRRSGSPRRMFAPSLFPSRERGESISDPSLRTPGSFQSPNEPQAWTSGVRRRNYRMPSDDYTTPMTVPKSNLYFDTPRLNFVFSDRRVVRSKLIILVETKKI